MFKLDVNYDPQMAHSIVVLGASGDLAKKKTFPALFGLFVRNMLPTNIRIVGFARSEMPHEKFQNFIFSGLKGAEDKKRSFVSLCSYSQGHYDSHDSFKALNSALSNLEAESTPGATGANRVFYMAIPPSVFVPVARMIHSEAQSKTGWNRVIVEKPFGRDLQSSRELSQQLKSLFSEDQLYRIDHYLGKELVQNLMALRFANVAFEPLWSRSYISSVIITFKEDIGTDGRGGYFDEYGIIRDVMQNHLLQMLSLVGMEPPVTLNAEDVRNEKVKLLRAIPPLDLANLVVGQYGPSEDGSKPGYLDDNTVKPNSIAPTFATAVVFIQNQRWSGVPFVLKCGKGLSERKAEIRIQFQTPVNNLFNDVSPNELVMRVQPGEAIYMKFTTKKPGLTGELEVSELDLSYRSRFAHLDLPDAYERLILDVFRGDQNLFVREDELNEAWRIFTPVLHQLDAQHIVPQVYPFGSRGPPQSDELVKKYGFRRTEGYVWPGQQKM